MQIGVIGCGRAAEQLHLPALARIPNVKVTALADAEAARLDATGTRWCVEHRYLDYHELVRDPSVDIVLIAVPAPLHHDVFLAAANSGKHTYIEKPLAMNLDEADRMLAAAAKSSIQTVVGFNLRSHRLVHKARELVRTGALGPIRSLRTVWVGGSQERPDWQLKRSQGGGVFYELGVHHFDLWRFLFDTEVGHVEAQRASSNSDDSDDSIVTVTAHLANNSMASATLALRGPAKHEVEIFGESASLCFSMYRADSLQIRPVGMLGRLAQRLEQLPGAIKAMRVGGDYLDSYRKHWLGFLHSLPDGESPATLHDGRESLRVALAAMSG